MDMDTSTLAFVILIFITSLGLYFATSSEPVPQEITISKRTEPSKKTPDLIIVCPAVLRQNVAVSRLVRGESV